MRWVSRSYAGMPLPFARLSGMAALRMLFYYVANLALCGTHGNATGGRQTRWIRRAKEQLPREEAAQSS